MTAVDVIIGRFYVANTGATIHGGLKIVKVVRIRPYIRVRVRTHAGKLVFAPGSRELELDAFRREATMREAAVAMPIHPVVHPMGGGNVL